jgi:hypothetical protein
VRTVSIIPAFRRQPFSAAPPIRLIRMVPAKPQAAVLRRQATCPLLPHSETFPAPGVKRPRSSAPLAQRQPPSLCTKERDTSCEPPVIGSISLIEILRQSTSERVSGRIRAPLCFENAFFRNPNPSSSEALTSSPRLWLRIPDRSVLGSIDRSHICLTG